MYNIRLLTPDGIKYIQCSHDEYIVDAAERQNVDLPYSCRAGACTSCAAKLIIGSVDQSDNSFLDDADIEEGWVLTCFAYPTSHLTLQTHMEVELLSSSGMRQTIEEQKREEEKRRQRESINREIQQAASYGKVIDHFDTNVFNGGIYEGASIHNRFTRVNSTITKYGNKLFVSINVGISDPQIRKNTYWGQQQLM
ncbi:hypothetical protein EIM44_00950 [Bibersteinia trehalosi]|uniref:2Fe-2S ferredoxin-type domain-containing protein n=2 Tax=Bibersteinia trehalosi TaxID=47735 RepID=A0A426FKJ9_BIBTR|nr:2Fe-2S iron-sulfur cluster-binding protein [Bibersteinia trehalosi]RRN05929.1 hypothetical protein EIM44_00950 [Bibersteinia trehalosi]